MKKILFIITTLLITFSFNFEVKAYEGFELTDEIVQINVGTPYQIQYTGDITGLKFNISVSYKFGEGETATITETGEITGLNPGVVTVEVVCKNYRDAGCSRYLMGIRSSLTILVNEGGIYNTEFSAIMSQYEDKREEIETEMNKISTASFNVNFVRSLMDLSFNTTDEITNEANGVNEKFGHEFISSYLPNYNSQVTGLSLRYGYADNNLEITGSPSTFTYNFGSFTAVIIGPDSNKKVVNINYATGNENDKNAVLDFARTLPINNKTYINLAALEGNSLDSLDSIINIQYTGSDIEKLINSKGLDALVDFRYGVAGIDPFTGGHIVLGKNGVYYTAQEFKIWSTLRLPKNPDKNMIESIQNYFETYLDDIDEIVVEEVEGMEDVYRVYINENEQITFLDRIINFFIPNVYAGEVEYDKMITFAVEEAEEEEVVKTNNPQTSVPNLIIYTSLAVISGLGLVITLKKKNN